jgi:hypothetical protein
MSSNVVQSTNFNTANITFSPPKSLDSGAKTAYLNYDGRSLIAQTASMNIPYGINKFDKNGPVKYSVDLSFRGAEDGSNKKMKGFYDMISALDEYMIDQGVKNSQLWFREKLGREVVKRFYAPMVRIPKDANGNPKPYPPTFKVSLKQRRGSEAFEVQVYDENKQPYLDGEGLPAPVSNVLVKGAQITCLIQCTGVWFAGTSKYGLSWKVVQIRTDSIPESMNGCGFADEDDEDVPSKPVRRSQPAAPAPVSMPALEDDEEDEVDDDEVFSAPVPASVAKKQSVLAAVAAPAPVVVAPVAASMDDEADDVEPVPVPKKKIVTAKKIVAKAKA